MQFKPEHIVISLAVTYLCSYRKETLDDTSLVYNKTH